jgi:UDP-N-acetylglucosamine--N-acetylmuramyl-(pentapeptide) pyrophosphoryl-undecaprenol N-acetylglucosamine transferase
MKVDIVFTCGGTGGHVYPVISIAQKLKNHSCVFFGSKDRQDARIIPRYDFSMEHLPSSSRNLWVMLASLWKSWRLLRQYSPSVVVSSGGYHTFPVVIAAKLSGIPIVLLEQNVLPGRVNRWLSKYADVTCVSFAASQRYFSDVPVVVTGNPVRESYLDDALSDSIRSKLPKEGKKILVFGGSQGAQAINQAIESEYERILDSEDISLVHVTGAANFVEKYSEVPYKLFDSKFGRTAIVALPYFENMELLYRWADCVVSRAGATTIAELIAFKKPAVLIPYPYAAENHQELNAKAFESYKAGKMVLQKDLERQSLVDLALDVCDPQASKFPTRNAADDIAQILTKYLNIV